MTVEEFLSYAIIALFIGLILYSILTDMINQLSS